jgi:hypothetical protein
VQLSSDPSTLLILDLKQTGSQLAQTGVRLMQLLGLAYQLARLQVELRRIGCAKLAI